MNKPNTDSVSRRGFLLTGMALVVTGCSPAVGRPVIRQEVVPAHPPVDPVYHRQRVPYHRNEKPGTIVVDRSERFLYFVEEDGWATRYGVGVGREGLTLSGRASVGRKAEWPSWTPTANMMRRDPRLLQYASGVPGGENNPLGARALYLYRGGRDTMFRLHGTNEPWLIGQAVSNGCVRLTNEDIIHLYDRTPVGTTVLIL
jgi:lipoprotein-anchoring transpeptidase ErfK/SrfK